MIMILLKPLQIFIVKKISMDTFNEWGDYSEYYCKKKRSYLTTRTLQSIWKYHSDGGPTCWHHLVQSVTLMASDPAVSIHEKLECFKGNGNNIEVRFFLVIFAF